MCNTVCLDLEPVDSLDIDVTAKLHRQCSRRGIGPSSKGCRYIHELKIDSVTHEHLDRSSIDQTKEMRIVHGAKPRLDGGRQIDAEKKPPKSQLGIDILPEQFDDVNLAGCNAVTIDILGSIVDIANRLPSRSARAFR